MIKKYGYLLDDEYRLGRKKLLCHWGTFHRTYLGPALINHGIANALSFKISNMGHNFVRRLSAEGQDGDKVTVTRVMNQEFVQCWRKGGWFSFKIMLDDGTIVTSDMISRIEIFLDDVQTDPDSYHPPIAYYWNMEIDPEDQGDPEAIKMYDTQYNFRLKTGTSEYERGKHRYDAKSQIFTFEDYQRTWPWMYGYDTETDDINKPTKLQGNACLKYNLNTGEYEAKPTSGYVVVVSLLSDYPGVACYYKIPAPLSEDLPRGYKYKEGSGNFDYLDASLIPPGFYLLRVPYFDYDIDEDSSYTQPGFVLYQWPTDPIWSTPWFAHYSHQGNTTYYCGVQNQWSRTITVRSSIPYLLYEAIYAFINSWAGNPGELDTYVNANHIVTGEVISSSGGVGTPASRIDGHESREATFTPISLPVDEIISRENMNATNHTMSIGWSGGAYCIDADRDFISNFYNGVTPDHS